MTSQEELREKIRRQLRLARSVVTDTPEGSSGPVQAGFLNGNIAEVDEFLTNDEFELAGESLLLYAQRNGPASEEFYSYFFKVLSLTRELAES